MCASTKSGKNKCGKDDILHAFASSSSRTIRMMSRKAGISPLVILLQAVFSFRNRDWLLSGGKLLLRVVGIGQFSWLLFLFLGLYLTGRL